MVCGCHHFRASLRPLISGHTEKTAESNTLLKHIARIANHESLFIPSSLRIPDFFNSAPAQSLSLELQFRAASALPSEALMITDARQREVLVAKRKSRNSNPTRLRRHREDPPAGPLRQILGEGEHAVAFFRRSSDEALGTFYDRNCTSSSWPSLPSREEKISKQVACCSLFCTVTSRFFCSLVWRLRGGAFSGLRRMTSSQISAMRTMVWV